MATPTRRMGPSPCSRRPWRARGRRQLKRLARLKQLSTIKISREELLMKLGGARDQSRIAWRLAVIEVAADSASFSYRLDRNKLRQAPVYIAFQYYDPGCSPNPFR